MPQCNRRRLTQGRGLDPVPVDPLPHQVVLGRLRALGPEDQVVLGGVPLVRMTGEPDRGPKPAGVAIADHVGAISMAFGLMVALFHRERTGEGQEVDASLLGGQLCIQTFNLTDYLWSGKVRGRIPRAGFNPTWSIYKGSDGKYFCLGMNREHQWPAICRVLDDQEWMRDERYAKLQDRIALRDELWEKFDALFSTRPAAEWVRLFSDADLLATPVNDYADVAQDPQALANDYITEIDGPDGQPVKMVGLPVIFSKTPGRISGLAPEFGQHTEEVLQEAGLDWNEISELRAAGAIGPRPGVQEE